MGVPSGLITRLTPENLEVFLASQTKGNPYKQNDFDSLGIGMFCETVAGCHQPMTVNDISDSSYWENNPHAAMGMKSYTGVPLCWDDGEIFGTFCMLTDQRNRFNTRFQELLMQLREVIEDDLHYILKLNELQKQLDMAQLHVKEAHHRIKNNFNMLIGYLQLHCADNSMNPRDIVVNMENRIRALSLVHEKLYKSHNTQKLSLDSYVTELTAIILGNIIDREITQRISVASITLPLETSIPIGLILSELLNNSIKYAFPENPHPEIRIDITQEDDGAITFVYCDNGTGYPNNTKQVNPESLGLSLIRMLCRQLHGEAFFTNEQGAHFCVELKL